jgi:two-component system phosphate regulon sensor histidine kinase PhoR
MIRRGQLILLTTIVALPGAALILLGAQLLRQDRQLERQRRAEILQDAADRAVSALERELASLTVRMADVAWPTATPAAGSLQLAATRANVQVNPPEAMAYWPTNPALEAIPESPFREADAAELERQDLARALAINRELFTSSNDGIRAGAQMRQGRILRKMNRVDDALDAYTALARITSVSINGLPADLQARKTRCALLAERARTGELRREAQGIDADVAAGRWRLDRQNYEYVNALLDEWLGSTREPRQESRLAMSAAVDWLYQRWTTTNAGVRATSGSHVQPGTTPITIVWTSTADRLAAFVSTTTWIEQDWLTTAQRAAAPATVSLAIGDAGGLPGFSTPEPFTMARSAAQTGLPWALTVALSSNDAEGQFESRRRTLLAALGTVLLLVGGGSYVVVRARSREMMLARLQSDFVTAVSHEFRTPLTALLQFNDLLDVSADLPLEKRRSYYHAQRRATERLHRLVESLLDFGRMEAGRRQYALERLDAGLLVRDIIDEFRDSLEVRRMTLRFVSDAGEHHVDADSEALSRALWNLLDNAAKYSADGGEIDVSVTRVDDGVSIAVRDRGIGIPASEQAGILQKFTRGAAATARRIRGTGVGLAMVQHIVTGHRGTLKVESVEGHGSTFSIVLPAVKRLTTADAEGTGNETHAQHVCPSISGSSVVKQ